MMVCPRFSKNRKNRSRISAEFIKKEYYLGKVWSKRERYGTLGSVKKAKQSRSTGFPKSYLDPSVRPQDDFFHFACGGWLKRNPIPSSKSVWGTFYILRARCWKQIRGLLQELSKQKRLPRGSEAQLIRDLYLSGMDMRTRNKLGIRPLERVFKKIDRIASKADLLAFIEASHKDASPLVWATGVGPDDKKSDTYTTFMWQCGITLPDRDFYLRKDTHFLEIQKKYVRHIERMFKLAGWSPREARASAHKIFDLETKLARISMDKVSARNIDIVYNKKSLKSLQTEMPDVEWKNYLHRIGLSKAKEVVVYQPDYLKKAFRLLSKEDLGSWKAYLYWDALHDAAPFLTAAFEREDFAFFGKVLSGSKTQEPLWERISRRTSGWLGQAVGKLYVKEHFDKRAKKEMDELVDNLFAAYKERIKKLDWMSPTTKKKALLKLSKINRKIGYPRKWRSYRGLKLRPNAHYENIEAMSRYFQRKQFRKLGKKVDKKEWFVAPQIVNAYYSPNFNEIVFPAGILQPPFFDPERDPALNYGAIGTVIGHELTHGFDDEGSKFDGKGNYKNWWTKKDRREFEKRTRRLVDQFNKFTVGELHVNGKLTLGENIADLGGIVIAYDAFQKYLKKHSLPKVGGFTPEQRFFLGLAFVECGMYRKEQARTRVMTDPHSPAKYRINGPYANVTEFYKAFNVRRGDKLYRSPKARIKIW